MNRAAAPPEPPEGDAFDIAALYRDREAERYALAARFGNEAMVKVLHAIGYDRGFVAGQGQYLFDRQGQRYLDLLSGWGVFGVGRNHPAVREALLGVLGAGLPGMVQMDVSPLAGVLAERLLAHAPYLQKVHFVNSGSEAVEAAIKLARKATGRAGVIYCEGAFHGLSSGALALNGEAVFREGFGPLLPGCLAVPFNDLAALEAALAARDVAAFIVEPIQGHSVSVAADGYLAGALALCRKHGALLVADEIQTGLGRTGAFLAIDHWAVEPDMVLISKTLSGGFVPVAAVLARKAIFDAVYDRLDRAVVMGSTFAGNDLAMAAGIATLEVMERERVTENAARLGERLMAAFEAMAARFEMVKAVRGKGLMLGVEFGRPASLSLQVAWRLLEAANPGLFCQLITLPLLGDHKILAQVAGHGSHTVKLLPSLIITDEDCDWIERAFDQVIAASHRVPGALWDFGRTMAANALRPMPRARRPLSPKARRSSRISAGSGPDASARSTAAPP